MKGIIFNLLQEIVVSKYGEDTWDDLLDAADLSGSYTSLGNYDDADLGKIVAAASAALNVPPGDVVVWVGQSAMPLLAQRFGGLFTPHDNTRSFILTLNDIIHPEVRKLYPDANPPDFEFDTSSHEQLVVRYRSARKMCDFAKGLILGAGDHYGETVSIRETTCMLNGDECCTLVLEFSPKAAAA